MQKQYTFLSDPGHGWLRVPLTEVAEAGILEEISAYSYLDNGAVWLEEDCDLSLFLRAVAGDVQQAHNWFSVNVITRDVQRSARVRNLPQFSPAAARQQMEG